MNFLNNKHSKTTFSLKHQKTNYLNLNLVGLFILSLFIFSCSNDDDFIPALTATSIEIVSGNNQSGLRETTLIDPIEFIIKNEEGNPFSGATISFNVAEGSVSSETLITNSEGKVSVNWTLGVTQGGQSLTVTAFKSDGTTPLTGSPMTVTATSLRPIVVGEFARGGVVFFVDDSGLHGLVCTTSFLGDFIWGCEETEISGADNLEIGGGQQNTTDILNGCNTAGIAARKCDELVLNGFDDWYLPSKLELNEMAINEGLITATSVANGGFIFRGNYWCSSEFSANTALRRTIDGVAVSFAPTSKNSSAFVRAIRSF